MADIDFQKLSDADAFTADSLQSRFDSIATGVNALASYGVRDGALNYQHVPTLVKTTQIGQSALTKGFTGTCDITSLYAGYGAATIFTTLSDGATALEITFTSLQLGMNKTQRILGFLVLANCVYDYSKTGPGAPGSGAGGVLSVQWFDATHGNYVGSGLRERSSEDFYNAATFVGDPAGTFKTTRDTSIRTLIMASDTGAVNISKIRFCGAVRVAGDTMRVSHANLTVIPLHATGF